MDGTFDRRLAGETARRAKSAKALLKMFSDVGENVKTDTLRLTDGTAVKKLISEHPFVAAGVALGAGVVAARLLTGRSVTSIGNAEPQRVIIEVKHGAASPAVPAPAKAFSLIDLVMQGVHGFETVQSMLRSYAAPKGPDTVNPVSPEVANEDETNSSASASTL